MIHKANVPSIAEALPGERAELWDRTARERAWYSGWPRFATNADILVAAHEEKLTFVHPDANAMPIGRLRNPELFEEFPPYLLKGSALALRALGGLWRRELEDMGVTGNHQRLAVTSLSRSTEMQNRLVADPAKLASPDSTHCAAASFDIDASGYYQFDSDGLLLSIISPDRDMQAVQEINDDLTRRVSFPTMTHQTSRGFDARVIDALLNITDILHRQGVINRIVEYEGTGNQCLHIAPNPQVFNAGAAHIAR